MLSTGYICSAIATLVCLAAAALDLCEPAVAADARLTIHVDQDGATINPTLYGIFFEEINRAGDGGLYAEMIENRSFEDSKDEPAAWASVGSGTMSLDRVIPIDPRNPTSLRVSLGENGGGVYHAGFKQAGLAIRKGESYRLSFYARAENLSKPPQISLESDSGTVMSQQTIADIDTTWKKYEVELAASSEDTIGDPAERQGNWCYWGYQTTVKHCRPVISVTDRRTVGECQVVIGKWLMACCARRVSMGMYVRT